MSYGWGMGCRNGCGRYDVKRKDVKREDVKREGVKRKGVKRKDVKRKSTGLRAPSCGEVELDGL